MSDREYVCGRLAREYGLGVSRRAAPIDPAAEKAVLEWLGRKLEAASAECSDHDFFNIKAIQRLLAEPRLPAEPSDAMIQAMRDHQPHYNAAGAYRALYAHLTKPATKTIEVWRVEWAEWNPILNNGEYLANIKQFYGEDSAHEYAYGLGQRANRPPHCIHVTGPHKQEVPNG